MSTLTERWTKMQELGEVAEENAGDVIKYMTTDNVARDLLTITEAHGRQKVSYWGLSYVVGLVIERGYVTNKDEQVRNGDWSNIRFDVPCMCFLLTRRRGMVAEPDS